MYLLIIVLLVTLIYVFSSKSIEIEGLDGDRYIVLDLPDKKIAADKLAELKRKVGVIMTDMKGNPSHPPMVMSENAPGGKYTSYTVNKGDNVFMCLRNPNDNSFIDDNTLMFVALHELAHILTKSIGHTAEFWANFRKILEHATNRGYYRYHPYHLRPVEYCGSKITSTPD